MSNNAKIMTVREIAEQVSLLKKTGKKVVLCHGEFDLFHPGHLKYLQGARREGDILVVTLTPDMHIMKGPGRPVYNEKLRAEFIASIEIVDFVGINEWPTAVELLQLLKPDVYCKGAEYKEREKDVTGRIAMEEKVINSLGGRLHLVEDITFSSSQLINRYMNTYPEEATQFLQDFSRRHTYTEIIDKIKEINNLKILVIGDTIVDQYYYCEALGKSPKSLNITTRFLSSETFAGGVLASANNVAQYAENVTLVSSYGEENPHHDFITASLNPRIKHFLFKKKGSPTTLKRRFVDKAFLGKMFEICFLNDEDPDPELQAEMLACLEKEIPKHDLIIVNDFGHGLINTPIMEAITGSGVFTAVNTQTNSANMGFNYITKYKKADYVCIDEPEIRLAASNKRGNVKKLMLELYEKLDCRTIAVTRGHKGAVVYDKTSAFAEAPVFSAKVVDTVGAGDAFFSITAGCAKLGLSPEEIAFIGNVVGALAVLIVCNREPVAADKLFKFITTLLK